jgi:hypothetical protein
MGLKGYRLWVMGQLDSTCRAPLVSMKMACERLLCAFIPVVALQVAFERQTLKPGFHLIGYRLWV